MDGGEKIEKGEKRNMKIITKAAIVSMICGLVFLMFGCAGNKIKVDRLENLDAVMKTDKVILLADIEASNAKVVAGAGSTGVNETNKKIVKQSSVGLAMGAGSYGLGTLPGMSLLPGTGVAMGALMVFDAVNLAGAASAHQQLDRLEMKLTFPYVVEYQRVRRGEMQHLFEMKAKRIMSDQEVAEIVTERINCGWILIVAGEWNDDSRTYYVTTNEPALSNSMYYGKPGRSNFWRSNDFSKVSSVITVSLSYGEKGTCGGKKEAEEYLRKYAGIMVR